MDLATASIAILGNTLAVDLRLLNLVGDTVNEDDSFWVKETIPAIADISISGNGAKIPSPWVLLTVPRKDIIKKPTFVDSQNAYSSLQLDDNDNYYMLYKCHELTGGTRATYPYPFQFLETPKVDGDTIDIKLSILNASGVINPENLDKTWNINTIKELAQNNVLYETEKTYIAKKQEIRVSYGRASFYGGKAAESRDKLVSDIWDTQTTVMTGSSTTGAVGAVLVANYAFEVPQGMTGNISNRPLDYITMKWTLPEYAAPRQDMLNQGWVWDENTRILSRTIKNPSIQNHSDALGPRGTRATLNVIFNNAPLDEVFDAKVELSYRHKGEQEEVIPELTTRIRFKPSYFTQPLLYKSLKIIITAKERTIPEKHILMQKVHIRLPTVASMTEVQIKRISG